MNNSGAVISKDKLYRYALWRIWDDTKPYVLFIMLNPSTAEADISTDDATTRRCRSFANDNGFGGFYIGNLFAFRARKYKDLLSAEDKIGPEYHQYLSWMFLMTQKIIFAWGTFPIVKTRQASFIASYPDAFCLGITKNGFPRHPLYVASNQPLVKYCAKLVNNNTSSSLDFKIT